MSRIQIGEQLPDFTVDTQDRDGVRLHSLFKGITILRVLRYVGCPTCRIDIHDILARYDEFTARGAQVLVVMQSSRESLRAQLAGEDRVLTFVCDTDLQIYKALAIDPAKDRDALIGGADPSAWAAKRARADAAGYLHGPSEGIELQLPAMFIVDEAGKVLYAHYGKTIPDIPTVDEMLAILDGLNPGD